MIDRLKEYVYGDPRRRRNGDRISLGVAFVWFVVSELWLSSPSALTQSVLILLGLQVVTTVFYCLPEGLKK
jgi:hypothetical protein